MQSMIEQVIGLLLFCGTGVMGVLNEDGWQIVRSVHTKVLWAR